MNKDRGKSRSVEQTREAAKKAAAAVESEAELVKGLEPESVAGEAMEAARMAAVEAELAVAACSSPQEDRNVFAETSAVPETVLPGEVYELEIAAYDIADPGQDT